MYDIVCEGFGKIDIWPTPATLQIWCQENKAGTTQEWAGEVAPKI